MSNRSFMASLELEAKTLYLLSTAVSERGFSSQAVDQALQELFAGVPETERGAMLVQLSCDPEGLIDYIEQIAGLESMHLSVDSDGIRGLRRLAHAGLSIFDDGTYPPNDVT